MNPRSRRPGRLAAAALAVLVLWTWDALGPGPAGATVTTWFANYTQITIPDVGLATGPATPFPSSIVVTGLGQVRNVRVTLLKVSCCNGGLDGIDLLLVGPGGQTALLMSDAAGSANDVTLTFDDAAASFLPQVGPLSSITSGTFRPTNVDDGGSDVFSAPAPAGPYGATLSVFNGTSANGTWRLFMEGDRVGTEGSIVGGWRLTITATEPGGPLPDAVRRVSVASDGTQGYAGSGLPAISADGRFVVFDSSADDLTSNCANETPHVYVHDRVTGATTCVSVTSDGTRGIGQSFNPSISGDGRFVAFYSDATSLVLDDTNGVTDTFVHDRATGTTTRVSVPSGGGQANLASSPVKFTSPAISADGRFIAFVAQATNLVAGGCVIPGFTQIFVHDRATGMTTCITVAPDGSAGNGTTEVNEPKLSADGRIVAFRSNASNLDPRCANGLTHVYVHDRLTGVTTCVSLAPSGAAGNGTSREPRLNADGRFVVFESGARNLAFPCITDVAQLFLLDRLTGSLTCVSLGVDGTPGNAVSTAAYFSDDGRFLAIQTASTNLVAGCANANIQVLVFDRATGARECVSVSPAGAPGNGFSGYPKLSADGSFVAFFSSANNLVPGDTNGVFDIFVAPVAIAAVPLHPYDYDRRDDLAIYRVVTGQWLVSRSAGFTSIITWGDPAQQDAPVSADFDGDGQGDIAVYRGATGQWFLLLSGGGVFIVTWGDPAQQDVPVAADFDGDGRADIAVYRGLTGQWFVLHSGGGVTILTWGDPAQLDVPAPGDFDGDGRADITVYRRRFGQWFVLLSGGGAIILTWGDPAQNDVPVPGRYDADARADIAVYRHTTGQWFVLDSTGGATILTWGDPRVNDVPVPADYDGDGRTDIAVYRQASGEWFILNSGGGVTILNTGMPIASDEPRPLRQR